MGDLSAKNVDCESLTFRTYSVRRKQSSGQTSEKEREGRERGAGGSSELQNYQKNHWKILDDTRRNSFRFVLEQKKKGKNASDVLVSAVKFTSIGSEVAQRDVYRTNRQFNSSSYFHTGGSSRLNFVS